MDIEDRQIVLGEVISTRHVLVCRRTIVYGVTIWRTSRQDCPGIIKVSNRLTTSTPEWEFIEEAQAKIEHLSRMIFHQDLTNFSDGSWGTLFPGRNDLYGDRVLRTIVLPRHSSISEVLSAGNFISVLQSAF